ncbi:hypothetical protein QJQ45_012536 [Haematococcus lacustris]|nr:hypothetical protein QJQ45_012536 [Haematococcus lacustris]
MEEINWDQIDKTKFFLHGLGLFSGTQQTAVTIWRHEGVPGFYRGFSTVIFGTIPSRSVYLSTLEMVKSSVAKVGQQLELSDTTIAGVSNFAGGACASMSTQLVSVPMDVISQRQMMQGAETHTQQPPADTGQAGQAGRGGGSASSRANTQGASGASSGGSGGGGGGGLHGSTRGLHSWSSARHVVSHQDLLGQWARSKAASTLPGLSHPPHCTLHNTPPQHGNPSPSPSPSTSTRPALSSGSPPSPRPCAASTAKPAPGPGLGLRLRPCTSPAWPPGQQPPSHSQLLQLRPHPPGCAFATGSADALRCTTTQPITLTLSPSPTTLAGPWTRVGGRAVPGPGLPHLLPRPTSLAAPAAAAAAAAGHSWAARVHSASSASVSGMAAATAAPEAAQALGAAGGGGRGGVPHIPMDTAAAGEGGRGGGEGGRGRPAGAAGAPVVQRLGSLAMARSILREEGVRGLYRGFGMSVATFVPSSAIWWSAYGVYTKLLAPLLPRPAPALPSAPAAPAQAAQAVAAYPSQQAAFMAAAARGPKEGGQDAVAAMAGGQQQGVKGWQVAVLQVSASVLAGATSSLLTNPLDLIKTRIQVARKAEGQACTARSVVREVLRQDGPLGLFRGVLPRMASAALWGTCMVTSAASPSGLPGGWPPTCDVFWSLSGNLSDWYRPVKAMVDKKRGVRAKCANALKASEVMAQRRAAEAEAKAQAGAAEAEAQAQADAGAYEAKAQLHQLQIDLKHREQQLADKERLQQLRQQLQDLQRSELQRKEQQLAVLVMKQQAALRQWEQQLTGQQQQLQQQLREQQQQLDQQQADLHLREQQVTEQQHQLQPHSPLFLMLCRLDEHQAAAAAIATAAAAVLRAAVEAEGQEQQGRARAAGAGAAGSGARNTPLPVWDLRSLQQQQQPQPLSISPQAWQRRLQPLLDEFQQYPVEEGAELLDRLQQHRRMRSVVSLATGVLPPTPDQVLGGIMVESLRPVLAGIKPALGGQRSTNQQPCSTALAMIVGSGIEQHGIKTTARQRGITPKAVKRARRSHMSNLAAGPSAVPMPMMAPPARPPLSQPGAAGVRAVRRARERMSRRCVDRSLKILYMEYERQCPANLKVRSTTFELLRPPWVKRITAAHKQVCVCIPCETCELQLDQLEKHMDSLVLPEDLQPRDDSDSDSGSNSDGGDAEVHVLLAEHISNADAQDLAGVLDAGELGEGGLEKLVGLAQHAWAAADAAAGGAGAVEGTVGGAAGGTTGGAAVSVDLDYATVRSWFVCPCKEGAKPRLACLQRQCDACKDRKVGVKAGHEGVQLQYRLFKKLDNGQGVELATFQTTLGKLVADLNDLMQKQLWHQHLAKH